MVLLNDAFEFLKQTIMSCFAYTRNFIIIHPSIEERKLLSKTLWKILPFTPILVLLWPILLPLLMSITSVSAWVFWIFTSLLFGALQFIYVLYQFPMIGLDLGVLTVLKTFAFIRSNIRYYTIKSGLSANYRNNNKDYMKRRGRKREWRMKLTKATNFTQFQEIEIEEPIPTTTAVDKKGIISSIIVVATKWGHVLGSMALKKKDHDTKNLKFKRSMSCIELDHETVGCSNLSEGEEKRLPTTLSRAISDESLYFSGKIHEDKQISMNLEKELGVKGGMLAATTSRFREVRLQASSGSKKISVKPILEENYNVSADEVDETFENRKNDDPTSAITFLLTGIVKRNHLSVEDILIEDAQSVMESGRHRLSVKARNVMLEYHEEVERCLDWIAESSLSSDSLSMHERCTDLRPFELSPESHVELFDRMNLLRKMKHNMGRSALMLSGGGAQAMCHLGTIKALCESGLYKDISVISGTSGGSIAAAMCAIKTPEELLKEVCVPHVSTDFGLLGEMKRNNIRWFPKVVDMCGYWLKHRLLVDSKEFKRCCEFYFKDITFEEAFEKTGKHVCITVSASRVEADGGRGAQRLLLNHISTPHVTLASAVAASCALPGVMAPAKLATKNSVNKKEPFEVDGVEWIDGSVQADLPFKRISTLFNVSNYIVCQANFHVLPFLRKPHHPNRKSFYWRAFQTCEWDMRNRVLNLSRFGLFPKIFGQDISKVFKQKYHGNLTLVPQFTTKQVFGLNALVNPTVEHMEIYLQNGQAAAWPYLNVIKEMLRLETCIDRCICHLAERIRDLAPVSNLPDFNDDVVSDTSSRARFLSAHREKELLKERVHSLELENLDLKKKLSRALDTIQCKLNCFSQSHIREIGFLSNVEEDKKEEE